MRTVRFERKVLTTRQKEILGWIKKFVRKNGYPPSRQELADAWFFNVNAAQDHLKALDARGAIKLIPGTARGLRVL